MNKKLLSILACPKCKGCIKETGDFLICKRCLLAFPVMEKVAPNMLIKQAWKIDQAKKKKFKHNIKLTHSKGKNSKSIEGWEIYNPNNSVWGPNSVALSMYLIDNLPRKKYLSLEAGCGSGKWSLLLSTLGYHPVLVDFQKHCLLSAKNTFRKYGKNGHFVLADIKRLPFKEKVFDVCFNDGTMEHFKENERKNIFKSMSKLLTRNGILAIGVPNKWNPFNHIFEFFGPKKRIKEALISPHQLEKELKELNLDVKKHGTFLVFSPMLLCLLIQGLAASKKLREMATSFSSDLLIMHEKMAKTPLIRLSYRLNWFDKYFGEEIFYIGRRLKYA